MHQKNVTREEVCHYLDGQRKDLTVLGANPHNRMQKIARVRDKLQQLTDDDFEAAYKLIMGFQVADSDPKEAKKAITRNQRQQATSLYDAVVSSAHDLQAATQVPGI